MRKTVRYAIGAAGAIPALGMLAAPAGARVTAPTAKILPTAKKAVRSALRDHHSVTEAPLYSCIASIKHSDFIAPLHITFWSKPSASRVCIGTIKVSTSASDVKSLGVNVQTKNGNFCSAQGPGVFFSHRCRKYFTTDGLKVCGALIYDDNITLVGCDKSFL